MVKNEIDNQIFIVSKRISTLEWDLKMISNQEQRKIKESQLDEYKEKLKILKSQIIEKEH